MLVQNGMAPWSRVFHPQKVCQQWTCENLRDGAMLATCKYAHQTHTSLGVNDRKMENSDLIEFGISVQKYDVTVVRIVCSL